MCLLYFRSLSESLTWGQVNKTGEFLSLSSVIKVYTKKNHFKNYIYATNLAGDKNSTEKKMNNISVVDADHILCKPDTTYFAGR